ncbi:hypothetical protein, conserved in T.vivax [Trypanosoma vivax Y486]|uniref:Uncharacterized protein n=1 Tax=Trypanosoma vivax (strain Y486) TaxID=1055687 RepID=F9WPL6_TRYVY|nr:hypothetical protein, conserved in T.vivax [Trypanosoma vivax Y486]|eukprot:CCD19493.1 hypothetical protein, conserved in T.vivax [Trypanosoma vivax Y486]
MHLKTVCPKLFGEPPNVTGDKMAIEATNIGDEDAEITEHGTDTNIANEQTANTECQLLSSVGSNRHGLGITSGEKTLTFAGGLVEIGYSGGSDGKMTAKWTTQYNKTTLKAHANTVVQAKNRAHNPGKLRHAGAPNVLATGAPERHHRPRPAHTHQHDEKQHARSRPRRHTRSSAKRGYRTSAEEGRRTDIEQQSDRKSSHTSNKRAPRTRCTNNRRKGTGSALLAFWRRATCGEHAHWGMTEEVRKKAQAANRHTEDTTQKTRAKSRAAGPGREAPASKETHLTGPKKGKMHSAQSQAQHMKRTHAL